MSLVTEYIEALTVTCELVYTVRYLLGYGTVSLGD